MGRMAAMKWISFHRLPQPSARKTSVWAVLSTVNVGDVVGRIAWYGAWRKYAFYPEPNTVFEPTCLRDITTFIEERMAERKAERQAARAASA